MNEPLSPFLRERAELGGGVPGPWTETGTTVARRLTEGLDSAIRSLAPTRSGSSVVAVGGYGRAEMCLASDVDLMIVHDGTIADDDVQGLLYPLWDARLKVGHSVRTPRQVAEAAGDNIETLTSLLGARLIAGSGELWSESESLVAALVRRKREWILAALKGEERVRRLAEPFQLQAVDTKRGRGGLRSLHGLGWERAVQEGDGTAIPEGSPEEEASRSVLLAVRNAIHAVATKPIDEYAFDLRAAVAEWLGEDEGTLSRELYATTRSVERMVDDRWPDLMVELTDPIRSAGRWLVRSLRHSRTTRDDRGALAIVDAALERPPGRLFGSIEELKLRTAPGPQWSEDDRATFVRLLAAGRLGQRISSRLQDLGYLTRMLPELAATYSLPQAAPFHEHPVADHQWRTVSELLAITGSESSEPWCRDLAEELGSLDELLVASLLHDVGKGRGGDHSIIGADLVAAFGERAGFGRKATQLMAQSVRWHLLLPQVATRRDIGDSAVVAETAQTIGDPQLVRMLALLAVADAKATGSTVWTPWKAALVRSLTSQLLGGWTGELGSETNVDEILAAAEGRHGRGAIERHLSTMGPGYTARFETKEILRHLELSSPRPADGEVAVGAEHEGQLTSLVVAAPDRPGLLGVVAGVLALHGVDVLDARRMVGDDGLALDTFYVTNARRPGRVSDHTVNLLRRDLERVLDGRLDLEGALRQRRRTAGGLAPRPGGASVRFETDAGTGEEIVEVRGPDRPGFLHDVARLMFEEGLDVRLAKIDTRAGLVTDVFYLRSPVTDRHRLEQKLLAALGSEFD